jgi:hypothetical protein
MDFAPLRRPCQLGIMQAFVLEKRGGFVVSSWWICGETVVGDW